MLAAIELTRKVRSPMYPTITENEDNGTAAGSLFLNLTSQSTTSPLLAMCAMLCRLAASLFILSSKNIGVNSEVLSEKFGDDYPLLVDVVNSLLFDVSRSNSGVANCYKLGRARTRDSPISRRGANLPSKNLKFLVLTRD